MSRNEIRRFLTTAITQTKKSILLLGPRQVGKSTLIASLKPDLMINLSDEAEYFTFSTRLNELRDRIDAGRALTVFIDEVQRLPALLNTVQALLDEKRGLKFFLTGSSARKLKRGNANLLPGRIFDFRLGPLVSAELDYDADTDKMLSFGSLPEIYVGNSEPNRRKLLRAYVSTYIQEEIKAESLVRNVDQYSRAIEAAITLSGRIMDYSKIAKQSKIARHNVARFFEIFEDTLIGFRVWPDPEFEKSADLVRHPRFFVFDLGVYNSFAGGFEATSDRKGLLAEQLVATQLVHSSWAKDMELKLTGFRTRGGLEVDFLCRLERKLHAIEVKGGVEPGGDDVQSLLAFKRKYAPTTALWLAHLGKVTKKIDGVWCLPWQALLKELGL